ncbi:MAG: glycosyltransferase family 2 protein [Syntrophomonadaceae bacterium]|nr:glycosyltransferase family 2 protein [Syntrophomonadaceae bacterium]MDD3898148.1 glycosyltransferase family 2 protein [Syntrophomonadaceae bacterium]
MLKVMIGCPVRDRAWILPRYLDCLEKLNTNTFQPQYCFIINDCSDHSPQILAEFARRQPGLVRLIEKNYDSPGSYRRGQYNFSRLAELRNLLLNAFLQSDGDYLFSLDSDLLVPAGTLTQLLTDDRDIVSALVCNGHEIGDPGIYNILERGSDGSYIHIRDFPRNRVFPVDCTGAAYLIKRTVIAAGVRYSSQYGGEDIAFCEAAASRGFNIFCDGRVECLHLMREGEG